jgi:Mannosylglycerate hydrolase MGH1-like glycoside hydrolase domain
MITKEHQRLAQHSSSPVPPWRKWGPYLAERSWATVREDYSEDGNAWEYLSHDMARSKTYRWGEDGLAGFCDRYQILCFALALWNEQDPILKERLFGLVPGEGNHGEDVKEYYFYLDATPTHSYLKYLYKYPQAKFPYQALIEENRRRRGGTQPEFELLDTGIFDEDRYFDVFVEFAKADPEDICIRIEVVNRGPDPAPVHVIPHLWFRNTWSWDSGEKAEPHIVSGPSGKDFVALEASDLQAEPLYGLSFDYSLGRRFLYAEGHGELLFTDNETNAQRVWGISAPEQRLYVKDAFHRRIINGEQCTNPDQRGTKACIRYGESVPPGGSFVLRLRLSDKFAREPLANVDQIIALRREETDEFYESIHPPRTTADERLIQRQAFAGLIWTRQMYLFDVNLWRAGDNSDLAPRRNHGRNARWLHLNSKRILSMPDKWEYPWFAAWDLAFQCVPMALIDAEFAKEQLWFLLFEQFQHPNGQIPSYEWEFSDLNPPVHAWAVWRVYNMDRIRSGKADRLFLQKCFHKLLINFTWWINRVDHEGNNIFEGGFLGLDNITVVDRSLALPHGGRLDQSDATGWMGMFCLNLMRIALELAREDKAYEALATKYFQHYIYVGAAMKQMGSENRELWDEQDGFFYDILRYPNGDSHKFRVRSLVGLIPLYAIEQLDEAKLEIFPEFLSHLHWFIKNRQDLVRNVLTTIERDGRRTHVLAILDENQIRRLLDKVWDPEEFRSDYGLRSLSKYHRDHPFVFGDATVSYEPGLAAEALKGGNSNWRGPVWFPMTFMMIESLRKLGTAYGHLLKIDNPVKTEPPITLYDMARGFADRLMNLYRRNELGNRPAHGSYEKLQHDPYWRDALLFFEFFHGDSGMGLGASHQTGWTALIASLIDEWRR